MALSPTFVGYSSAARSNATPQIPSAITGVMAGDFLLAVLTSASTITAGPPGWTNLVNTTIGAVQQSIWYCFHDGHQRFNSSTWTAAGAALTSIMVAAFRDVDFTTPFDVTYVQTSGTTNNVTSTGITPVTAGAALIYVASINTNTSASFSASVPSGWTSAGSSVSGMRAGMIYDLNAPASASGSISWTTTGTSGLAWGGTMLALRGIADRRERSWALTSDAASTKYPRETLPSALFGTWNYTNVSTRTLSNSRAMINTNPNVTTSTLGSSGNNSSSLTPRTYINGAWAGPPLNAQTIAAGNWIVGFNGILSNASASRTWGGYGTLVVVNGATGGLRGTIFSDQQIGAQGRTATARQTIYASIAGSSVVCQNGDYLLLEIGTRIVSTTTSASSSPTLLTNGTTDFVTDAVTNTSPANYLTAPAELMVLPQAVATGIAPALAFGTDNVMNTGNRTGALTDDFNDGSLNAQWTAFNSGSAYTMGEAGGVYTIDVPLNTAGQGELYAAGRDFRDSYMYAAITTTIPANPNVPYFWFMVFNTSNNYVQWLLSNGNLVANIWNGSSTNVYSVAYNGTTHKYLRLRHSLSAGLVYWDYSADGSSWTTAASSSIAFSIPGGWSNVTAHFGTSSAASQAYTLTIDNFNTIPVGGGSQTINGSFAIGPALAFGTQKLSHRLTGTGLNVPPVFGTAALRYRITAPAVAPVLAFGTAQLANRVAPSGLSVPPVFGTAKLANRVAPTGIAPALALGTAALRHRLTGAGIAPALNFGTVSLNTRAYVLPTAVGPLAAFGTASATHRLTAAAIAPLLAFGTASLTSRATVAPSAIGSAHAFGTASANHRLGVGGIVPALTIGNPTVQCGAVSVFPTGIASAFGFGTPAIAQRVAPTGLHVAPQFGAATVAGAPVTLAPASVAPQVAFGTPAIALVTAVAPVAIPPALTFGAATLHQRLHLSGVAPAYAVGTPEVRPVVRVLASGIGPAVATGTPAVSTIAHVAPLGIATGELFGTASVGTTAATSPQGIGPRLAFGTATLALRLNATGIPPARQFGVARTALRLSPASIGPLAAFGAATLTARRYVAPAAVAPVAQFGTPALTSRITIAPAGLAVSPAFGLASVGRGAVTLAPAGIPPLAQLGAAQFTQRVRATGLSPALTFGQATLTARATVAPTGVAPHAATGIPAVSARTVLAPAGIPTGQQFGTATLSARAFVAPSAIGPFAALGTPSLRPVAYVAPGGVAPVAQFGAALIKLAQRVAPVGVAPVASLGQPAVAARVVVAPLGVAPVAALGLPLVRAVSRMLPASIPALANLGQPVVAPGPVAVQVPAIGPVAACGMPNVRPGPVTLTPLVSRPWRRWACRRGWSRSIAGACGAWCAAWASPAPSPPWIARWPARSCPALTASPSRPSPASPASPSRPRLWAATSPAPSPSCCAALPARWC